MATKQELVQQAQVIWRKYRNGGRPTEKERDILRSAYWDSCLPKDLDYSVAQWVEDGFPQLP